MADLLLGCPPFFFWLFRNGRVIFTQVVVQQAHQDIRRTPDRKTLCQSIQSIQEIWKGQQEGERGESFSELHAAILVFNPFNSRSVKYWNADHDCLCQSPSHAVDGSGTNCGPRFSRRFRFRGALSVPLCPPPLRGFRSSDLHWHHAPASGHKIS